MSKTPIFILMGPPGAGKSSVAKKFPKNQTIMFGNLIRSMRIDRTDGGLLETQKANQILHNELKNKLNQSVIILEGYPRTIEQAQYLYSLKNFEIIKVLKLECSDKECIDRVLNRESCNCGASYHPRVKPPKEPCKCDLCGGQLLKRANDTAEILQKRLNLYRQSERDILKIFDGKCQTIDIEANLRAGINETISAVQNALAHQISNQAIKVPLQTTIKQHID